MYKIKYYKNIIDIWFLINKLKNKIYLFIKQSILLKIKILF